MKTRPIFVQLLSAAVAVGLSLWAAHGQSVTISNILPVSGTQITNGLTVKVSADVVADGGASILGVYVAFSWQGSTITTNEMTHVTGNQYEAVIPRFAAGAISNRVFCIYTAGNVTNDNLSAIYSYNVSSNLLDRLRATDFGSGSGWTPSGSSYYSHTNKVGVAPETWWIATNTFWPINLDTQPPGGSGYSMGLRPIADAFIRSPRLDDGVGTIYFTSIIDEALYGAEMVVQVTTNASLNVPENEWTTVYEAHYPAGMSVASIAEAVVVNNSMIRYVRFLRLDNGIHLYGWYINPLGSKGRLCLDNIYFSQPPTDMTITEELHNPGYPAQDQDVRVRCRVTDKYAGYPSMNRRVRVFYSWQSESGPWTATNMNPIARDVYEGVIPKHMAGRMYYYFRCDYDGYSYSRDPDGAGPKPLHNENLSPAFLIVKGEDNYRNYEIRRFRSDVKVVRLLTDPPQATVDMELIDNNHWQGLTLVTGITNLLWQFQGIEGYTNDAPSYDSTPWLWGDNDQDFPNPPIAGTAERNATNSVVAQMEYDGFLVVRFDHNSITNQYIAKRAVYQNFNVWTAHPEEFERSLGLYSIKTFRQDFSAVNWQFDAYDSSWTQKDSFDLSTPTDFTRGNPAHTFKWWMYDYGRVVKERDTYDPVELVFKPRRAVELLNQPQSSRIWNTYVSKTHGVGAVSFKARLSLNDNYFSFFKGVTNGLNPFLDGSNVWPRTQGVEIVGRATALSPGHGYISIITWLQLYEDEYDYRPSYYETRFIQGDSTVNGQDRMDIEVYRWKNGTATKIGVTFTSQAAARMITGQRTFRVDMTSGANVQITPRVHFSSSDGKDPGTFDWRPGSVTDSSIDRLQRVGTVAFTCFDATMEVERLRVFPNSTTYAKAGNLLPKENWGSGVDGGLQNYWYMGGKRASDNQNRWVIGGPNNNALQRTIVAQTIGIYAAPMPPGEVLQPNLDEISIADRTVSTMNHVDLSVPLKLWNESFVILKNLGLSEMNVAIGDVEITPWRAVNRADVTPPNTEATYLGTEYYKWVAAQQQNWTLLTTNQGWLVLEGWVNSSAGSRGGEVQFDRSRANTNLVQALYAPYMTNNIGSIAFDWRASGTGDVVFAIERTAKLSSTTWELVKAITTDALEGTEFVPIRTDYPGRIRISISNATSRSGILKLDNLIARDNPPKDDTSWEAYNALITEQQQQRAFEPGVPGVQTAFLNNSPTNGVAAQEHLDEHQAFIQTPRVGTGIGEVAFWYRIWNAAGGPATLSLQMAKNADMPDGQWVTLTNIVVASNQVEWVYYSDSTIYQPEYKVLRLYCLDTGNRVCLDNVLMTEPVRGGFDFMTVNTLPYQPVVGEPPGLEVTIGRFIMNPQDIHIYVSFTNNSFASITNGTAVWGYTNWWSKFGPRYELEEVAPRKYRLPESLPLPAGAIDDVVQYIVWGIHKDIKLAVDPPIVQDARSYTNAAWYYPININAAVSGLNPYGHGGQGWSPYYFVYSCPPRSVWLNEIDYGNNTKKGSKNYEFLEIIGPAGVSMGNWIIRTITIDNEPYQTLRLAPDFTLGNVAQGWGFLVWGDRAVQAELHPNARFFELPGWVQNDVQISGHCGLRIIRSNGSWEDSVAWGNSSTTQLVNVFGFTYAGGKSGYPTLAKATIGDEDQELLPGMRSTDFAWSTAEATFGRVNTDQLMVDLSGPISYFMIYSVIEGNGSHDVGLGDFEMFEIEAGASTNIVYSAMEWHRIGTVLTNGVAVGSAAGLQVYTQAMNNVQGDISNHVTFVEATPVQAGLTNGVPLYWISGYYTYEADARADTNIVTDYLLDLDPRGDYDIKLVISAINVGTNVTVTVKLTDGMNPLVTTINGSLKVYGKVSLGDVAWTEIGAATIAGADFDGNGLCVAGPFDPQGYHFFRAVIE